MKGKLWPILKNLLVLIFDTKLVSRQRPVSAVEPVRETGGVGVLQHQNSVRAGKTPADVRPVDQIRGGQQAEAGVRLRGSQSQIECAVDEV